MNGFFLFFLGRFFFWHFAGKIKIKKSILVGIAQRVFSGKKIHQNCHILKEKRLLVCQI
jgi:hypothetical protein